MLKYLFLFIPFMVFSQDSIVYPTSLRINDKELVCFKRDQVSKMYFDYQKFNNCIYTLMQRDSTLASLYRENGKLSEISENDRVIVNSLEKKVSLYEQIVQEKDRQLKLKDREILVGELKGSKTNWSLEILIFLTGGLIGYAIAK